MNKFVGLAAAAGIAICGLASTAHANLLLNSEFSTGDFTDWTLTGNPGYISIITSPVHSGTYAASFGAVGSLTYLSQTVTDTVGVKYSVGGWLANDGGAYSEFDIAVNGTELVDLIDRRLCT